MIRKFAGIFLTLLFSTGILLFSVFRNASIKYAFAGPDLAPTPIASPTINYELAGEGNILPDSPFWPAKAARDRILLYLSLDPLKKSELNLLFSDKRLSSSKTLFERDKANLGYSTFTKAEKYLQEASLAEEEARSRGENTDEILSQISLASLKHVQVGEEILNIAPEDAKPNIIKTLEYAKNVYKDSKTTLVSRGMVAPENPFDWE